MNYYILERDFKRNHIFTILPKNNMTHSLYSYSSLLINFLEKLFLFLSPTVTTYKIQSIIFITPTINNNTTLKNVNILLVFPHITTFLTEYQVKTKISEETNVQSVKRKH